MAGSNNIFQKVQQVIRDWIKTQIVSDIPQANILAGMSRGALTDASGTPIPRIVVTCNHGTEITRNTGNWRCNVEVWIMSNENDVTSTEDKHSERVSAVFDLLTDTDLAETLSNSATDFTCFQVKSRGPQSWDLTKSGIWKSILQLEIDCCATDIF